MRTKIIQQIDFSSVLFDTLFGLVLFFSIDSFLDIKDPAHFIFYLFSLLILIHWWLIFKAADDVFAEEVTDSGLDLIIGIVELILIEYIVLTSRSFDYINTSWFLLALLLVDLIWTIVWRYVGKWRTTDPKRIQAMERELDNNLLVDAIGIALFLFLSLLGFLFTPAPFVFAFILLYLLLIFLTFRLKIIDIDFF